MSVTRIGKIALVLLFLAYLAILGETFRHRTGPTVSKEFPYLIFKAECRSDDSGPPESYWRSERKKGENRDLDSVTGSVTKPAAMSITKPISASNPKSETKPAAMRKWEPSVGNGNSAAWSIAPTAKKFAQASETIIDYPAVYSSVTPPLDPSPILPPPIPSQTVTTWSVPSYDVTYSFPVVSLSPVLVERPFFQSFSP